LEQEKAWECRVAVAGRRRGSFLLLWWFVVVVAPLPLDHRISRLLFWDNISNEQ